MKHARYGNAHPRTVLPFVVGHAGGIINGGMQFFRMYRDAADSKPNAIAIARAIASDLAGLSSWSSKGPTPRPLSFFCNHCHWLIGRALAISLW